MAAEDFALDFSAVSAVPIEPNRSVDCKTGGDEREHKNGVILSERHETSNLHLKGITLPQFCSITHNVS
jgi:hypothetical protein